MEMNTPPALLKNIGKISPLPLPLPELEKGQDDLRALWKGTATTSCKTTYEHSGRAQPRHHARRLTSTLEGHSHDIMQDDLRALWKGTATTSCKATYEHSGRAQPRHHARRLTSTLEGHSHDIMQDDLRALWKGTATTSCKAMDCLNMYCSLFFLATTTRSLNSSSVRLCFPFNQWLTLSCSNTLTSTTKVRCGAFGFCSMRERGEGMTHLQTATGHIGGRGGGECIVVRGGKVGEYVGRE